MTEEKKPYTSSMQNLYSEKEFNLKERFNKLDKG